MTTTAATLSDLSPVEIDTALAEIYGRYYAAQTKVVHISKWVQDAKDGFAKHIAGKHGGKYSGYSQGSIDNLLRDLNQAKHEASAILAESDPYDDEFDRRGGWSRFFLVKNAGGHIHSSLSCSTCFDTTQFGWLPNLSGLTEAEAVAEHGAILCTVCYPTAPTSWTNGTKPGDEDICTGSGKYYDQSQPSRTGYYSGNWGTCQGCGERQTVSKGLKIRKHKKP